jgi:predicted alpha/beta superfamily hydrolase
LQQTSHELSPTPPVPLLASGGEDPDAPSFTLEELSSPEAPALDNWCFHSSILPLPKQRTISIHLPLEYDRDPTRRFPVFYLHDGQNLFDPRLSYVPGRTWQAGSTEDALSEAGQTEPVILVGIANAGLRRMAEYTPTRDPRMAGGEGATYGRMLIEEIKPFIDRTYRTLSGAANTAIGGSSLGGLISLYLGLTHPDIFGKLAVMSPSIWWDRRSILSTVGHSRKRPSTRIWLDMGTAEGLRHLRDADLLHQRLMKRGWHDNVDLAYQRDPGAVHDEAAWASRFPNVLRFLFPASK